MLSSQQENIQMSAEEIAQCKKALEFNAETSDLVLDQIESVKEMMNTWFNTEGFKPREDLRSFWLKARIDVKVKQLLEASEHDIHNRYVTLLDQQPDEVAQLALVRAYAKLQMLLKVLSCFPQEIDAEASKVLGIFTNKAQLEQLAFLCQQEYPAPVANVEDVEAEAQAVPETDADAMQEPEAAAEAYVLPAQEEAVEEATSESETAAGTGLGRVGIQAHSSEEEVEAEELAQCKDADTSQMAAKSAKWKLFEFFNIGIKKPQVAEVVNHKPVAGEEKAQQNSKIHKMPAVRQAVATNLTCSSMFFSWHKAKAAESQSIAQSTPQDQPDASRHSSRKSSKRDVHSHSSKRTHRHAHGTGHSAKPEARLAAAMGYSTASISHKGKKSQHHHHPEATAMP
jgi:hypothetical protein